ncbi:MAG: hypothetical protein ACKO37_09940 [Vampirovibrionales bacterium]
MTALSFSQALPTLGTKACLLQHTLEQPQIIEATQKWVPRVFYPAMTAKILTEDVFRHDLPPQEKHEHLRRDLIVLPATIAGTLLATRWFMHNPAIYHQAAKGMSEHLAHTRQTLGTHLLEQVNTLTHTPSTVGLKPRQALIQALLKQHQTLTEAHALPELKQAYKHLQGVLHHADNQKREALDLARETLKEGADLLKRIETQPHEQKALQNKASHTLFTARLRALFPTETKEDNWDEVKGFVGAGAVTISSGVLSGLLANRLNKKDAHADQCVLKEGIFQMVANVLFCGLGVSLGEMATQALKLQNTTLPRMGVVGGGLLAGIASGSLLANGVGNAIAGVLMPHAPKRADRKLEVWDATIHVDDIPLLFKFGMDLSAMEPFIPPFFWFSGFRAGRGYRNKALGHHPAHEPSSEPCSSIPAWSSATQKGVAPAVASQQPSLKVNASSLKTTSFSNITHLPSTQATLPLANIHKASAVKDKSVAPTLTPNIAMSVASFAGTVPSPITSQEVSASVSSSRVDNPFSTGFNTGNSVPLMLLS